MSRSYRPIRPAQSRLLQQKWDQALYDEHRRRVSSVRPSVDTRPPQTFMHLHLKLKKLQLEEERLATIERDNRILLERMSHIMRSPGRINNSNDYERKSLNRPRRIRELLRITRENQQILKRITESRPEYDHVKWEKEWQANQQYIDQISVFPPDWWKEQSNQALPAQQSNHAESKPGSHVSYTCELDDNRDRRSARKQDKKMSREQSRERRVEKPEKKQEKKVENKAVKEESKIVRKVREQKEKEDTSESDDDTDVEKVERVVNIEREGTVEG